MKKQNEKNEAKNTAKVEMPVAKPKRVKKNHIFFLYVPERGFICAHENGLPTAGGDNPLHYSQRSKAIYAIEFFKSIKLADEIQLFMNVG